MANEPLIGWMIFDEYTEDMSQWDGVISCPDPTGANLAWQDPIKMIEYAAYAAVVKELADYKATMSAIDKRAIGDIILERDALAAENERWKSEHDNLMKFAEDLRVENERLKAQSAVLREALEAIDKKQYGAINPWQHQLIARAALAAFKAQRGN